MLQPQETQILAPGLNFFSTLKPPNKILSFHRIYNLVITFFAYASFHGSHKLSSIVKSVLEPSKSAKGSLEETGWAPFNDPNGTRRLGELDLAFLTSYAPGMYFAVHVGKQLSHKIAGILILTSSVAADLGTQDSNKGNSRALATVTAIIDGTGSVGAALGPLLAGYISTRGWNSVFLMLIVSIFFSSITLDLCCKD
ncbi:hypothetical protein EZV62_019211 [Acer yangbiense]|uniref:Major facilitator superfamily (MFS) profile domain-containing protein n=1 Tax=Acer yangbiense TaxID=1000413 RepID=A0A5C7HBP1_9ROSI|nr:hypothetical protein EZV62_019211 [Acer yangbiense]